jgi:hypothetical protein
LKDNLEILLLREKAGEAFAKQEVIVEQDEANSRRFVLASGLHPQNGKCIPSAAKTSGQKIDASIRKSGI